MASIDIPKSYTFQFPMGILSWKGRTIYQIVSRLRRVPNTNDSVPLYFLPNPVTRWYRREITTSADTKTSCSSRLSHRSMDMPGATLSTSSPGVVSLANGLVGTIDLHISNNRGEGGNACGDCNNNPENCRTSQTTTDNVCFRPDVNARRRCRSAGMIPRKFVNQDRAYFTNNKQYLHSRNRTIEQNNYVYIRQGASHVTPGTGSSKSNIYSASGLSHCPKYTISAALQNNQLQYRWINGTIYTIIIPDGSYDIFDVNTAIINQQILHQHYYINPANNVKTVLLTLGRDTVRGVNTVQVLSYLEMSGNPGAVWTPTQNTPQLILLNNPLTLQGLGMTVGTWPASPTQTQILYSQPGALLNPSYVPLYYKPSNPQYATQGGVSSSARLLRTKYNEIQKAANTTNILGHEVANSLAYNIASLSQINNLKTKIGYPMTCTPCKEIYGSSYNPLP